MKREPELRAERCKPRENEAAKRRGLGGFRILPVVMVIAAICFGIRFSQVFAEVTGRTDPAQHMSELIPAAGDTAPVQPPAGELKGAGEAMPADGKAAMDAKATAQEAAAADPKTKQGTPQAAAKDAPAPDLKTGAVKPDAVKADDAKPADTAKDAVKDDKSSGPAKDGWKGAEDLDDQYSDVKLEMFKDLTDRRKALDAREKDLQMREALLKATQAELTQKSNELNTVKADIQALLKQQTDQEDKRIASLVKIYEGMKPKDAATIFNTLDSDILLSLITKMAEKKSALVLAAMDPDKARKLTIMMAEQNKLPELPTLPASK